MPKRSSEPASPQLDDQDSEFADESLAGDEEDDEEEDDEMEASEKVGTRPGSAPTHVTTAIFLYFVSVGDHG